MKIILLYHVLMMLLCNTKKNLQALLSYIGRVDDKIFPFEKEGHQRMPCKEPTQVAVLLMCNRKFAIVEEVACM